MKRLLVAAAICFAAFTSNAQNERKLPNVDIKTLKNTVINTSTIDNGGKPIIISFWATWCKPCISELININEVYETWQKETGVKLIAVSTDDARNAAKVGPLVSGKGWNYEVYLDQNQDLKRALNVNTIPHTFVLNGNKEVVWQHNSYTEGSEKELYEIVKKVAKGEQISH